jgi:hypothetical protein
MSTAPAGWYIDIQRDGYERWFDGTGWTDRRRPVPTVRARAVPRSSGWLPVAAAFTALLVLMCGGAALFAQVVLDVSAVVATSTSSTASDG